MVLPRILPRIAEFISTGFKTLAFFIACVFSTAQLIPSSHPYLRSANVGTFGIMAVISAAANNLRFRKENIDQIIIFTTIIVAIALLALQIFSLLLAFIMPSAMAQIAAIFNPYSATGVGAASGGDGSFDIAMILLDRVFGVPGLFNSCVSTGVPCTGINSSGLNSVTETQAAGGTFPWAFHEGLHQMYLFYSSALLVVGVFIFIYFIMVVVIETAQTGTPFGRRFNSVWAPIRMVVAIGLLIPFAFGMNAAQYITLYAAKWGSGLATTAWFSFNTNLSQLTSQDLVGTPKAQNAMQLLAFASLALACEHNEERNFNYPADVVATLGFNRDIEGYLVKVDPVLANSSADYTVATYAQALSFYGNGNILIRFGDEDPFRFNSTITPAYALEKGMIYPACGELVIPTSDLSGVGSRYIYEGYYSLIMALWGGGQNFPTSTAPGAQDCDSIANLDALWMIMDDSSEAWMASRIKDNGTAASGVGNADYFNNAATKASALQDVTDIIQCFINNGAAEEIASGSFAVPTDLLMRGWAGAGIWYNKIAAQNGSLISAAGSLPTVVNYPITMERVARAKLRVDPNVSASDLYNPHRSAGEALRLPRGDAELTAAKAYYELYDYWLKDSDRIGKTSTSGNFFGVMLSALFGLDGLYSITDNASVHPLARLVGVGKGLIDATIRNLSVGTGALFGGVIASYSDNAGVQMGGQLADVVADVMFSVATIGLTAGFVLYYVIPFLPFIYFFFAVGNWLKTVFEAMVGVPLWALAHIRIDGNGLPGDAAMNGYYLIFEIFLRPIMIIFGLVAGISVFAAMAAVLHDIWDIVLANVGGTGATEQATMIESIRGPVDKLFYLVVYTIILYMMAVSSFKLVELIPQQILRWLGANVPSFVDQSQDAAGGLVQYAAIGGGHMFGQLTGGTKDAMSGMKAPGK
jgi:conjugal transfer/type IV secretion protein DotA/TraY